MTDPRSAQMQALGAYIRSQRQLADLSLRQLADLSPRQLAELTSVSNPYLGPIERGLHQPSVRVLELIAEALNLSTETLLAQAGLLESDDSHAAASTSSVKTAIAPRSV